MKLEKICMEKDVEAILISNYYNIRYFTGFTGSNGFALITKKGGKYFFTDFRYFEQADNEVIKNGFRVIKAKDGIIDEISKYIKEENIQKMGIEDEEISLKEYKNFEKKFSDVKMIALADSLLRCRMIKSEDEIANIKRAVEIADNSFRELITKIRPGVSERDLANKLEYLMKKNGATDRSFDTIVASGARAAMPHGIASDKTIESDKFLLFDFGAYYNGYVSDMTRTLFFGKKIDKKHEEIYNIVKEAQELGIKNAVAGTKTSELDKIVRDFIIEKGYGENFGHSLGHGIGLEIHEMPTVSQKKDIVLEENMVITIEPGIYIEGFGGVRIEDDVIVKKDKCEVLNKFTKHLTKI